MTAVYASDGTLLGYIHSDTVFVGVRGSQIPLTLKHATVAIEDRRFFQHGALDYQGIIRAGIRDVFGKGGSLQGASTLTMQLVDNRYLDGTKYAAHHDLKYKIVQAKLAEQLVKNHAKGWILDHYLNVVPYGTVGGRDGDRSRGSGRGVLRQAGAEARPGSDGAPGRAAPGTLAVQPVPRLRRGAEAARGRFCSAMVQSHYITAAEADAADAEPLGVHHNTSYSLRRQPFVFDFIQQQLIQRFGLKTGRRTAASRSTRRST